MPVGSDKYFSVVPAAKFLLRYRFLPVTRFAGLSGVNTVLKHSADYKFPGFVPDWR